MALPGFRSLGFLAIRSVMASNACGTNTAGFATPDAAGGSAPEGGTVFDATSAIDGAGGDAVGVRPGGQDGASTGGDDAMGYPMDAAVDVAATPPDAATTNGSFQNSL